MPPCVSNPNGPGCTPEVVAEAHASYVAQVHREQNAAAFEQNREAVAQWMCAARIRALEGNEILSDAGNAWTTWFDATDYGQDDKWGATYSRGLVCFGRPACDAAMRYLGPHRDDLGGAIDLAANYCFDHPDKCASWMRTANIARAISAFGYGVVGGEAGLAEESEVGLLERETNLVVRQPLDCGRLITDVGRVENGVLWEEKSVVDVPGDPSAWIAKDIDGKLAKYIEARRYRPGYYADAPIGFSYTSKVAPALRAQIEQRVEQLRQDNPGVTILTRFTQ